MTRRLSEATAQLLDPLGGITARFFALGAGVGAFVVSVAMSVASFHEVEYPLLEGAALLMVAFGCVYYVWATSPFRAPFRRRDHAVVYALFVGALAVSSAAHWGHNAVVRDDWPTLALAIVTFTLGSWRPGWEILLGTVAAAALVAALAIAQVGALSAEVPDAVFGIVTAAPLLAAGAAACAFSNSLVDTLQNWRASNAVDSVASVGAASGPTPTVADGDLGTVVTPSYRELVDEEVLPFLVALSARDQVTEVDAEQARRLADELRTQLGHELEQSWLIELEPTAGDPANLAALMSIDERGFVRALVDHLRTGTAYNRSELTVTLTMGDSRPLLEISVPSRPGASTKVQLAPYIAVARTLFSTVDWQSSEDMLRLSLEYDIFRTSAPTPR